MSAQSSQPLNVAVVGTGMSLAVFHRPSIIALKDKFNLHTVVERSGSGKAAEITGPSVKLVKTLEEALDDKEVDLVVISTPNNTHFPFAKQALEKGKHVLIEKPFCVTSQQGVQLDELAEKNGLVLSVYQNRRWDSDFLTVRELINAGKFGDIVDFQSSYDRYRPVAPGQVVAESWKTAPGQNNDIIYNLGSHVIDQAYVLFGMPEKLSCRFDDVRGMGVEEGFNMELFYPPQVASSKTPMVVTISGSILSCLPRQLRFRIRGSKGSFIKYGLDPQEANLKLIGGRTDVGEGFGEEKEEMWGELIEARKAEQGEKGVKNDNVEFVTTKYKSVAGNYNALYENLYNVIKSGDKSRLEVKPQQAIDVLRLIELGQKAAKEERVVYVQ